MIFCKAFLFVLLTLSLSQAAISQTLDIDNPDIPDGEFDGGDYSQESYVLKESLAIFLSELPKNPDEAIEYIFAKLNKTEEMPAGRNMEFIVNVVDQISDGKIFDINPRFSQDNRLIFELTMKRSLKNNPVYMLEIAASLEHIFSGNHSYKLFSHEKKKVSYPHWYKNDQGQVVQDPGKMIHEYINVEMIHSVFQTLGIRMPPQKKGMLPLNWVEMQVNARKGSAYAARELYQYDMEVAKTAMNSYQSFSMIKSLTESQRREFVLQMAAEKGIKLDKSMSEQSLAADYFSQCAEGLLKKFVNSDEPARAQYKRERELLGDPEKKNLKDHLEEQQAKLNDLVKANDREGVANLLESYLPLEVMEPIEKGLWIDWLEAIRRPRPENAMLMFRGLDSKNDKPQVVKDKNNKEVGYGFFSTLLNRNQGNFTHRLRSLITMRYRFQNLSASEKSPLEATPTISSMMFNHAQIPSGSPMLSFTTSLPVALSFGREYGLIAAKIDSRRVLPNITSGFTDELELLVPLIVFPDEIVHFEKAKLLTDSGGNTFKSVSDTEFINAVNAKLGHDYTQDVSLNAREVFIRAYRVFADTDPLMDGGMCRRIFMK